MTALPPGPPASSAGSPAGTPAGADAPIEVTFPDGSTATFDQLRDMLDEFHDGELDDATREKIRYAMEHCPRLAQESSVIIGISRLLKSYEGPNAAAHPHLLSEDELSSKILGRLKNEPPPAKPAGFPWGAVVIGVVTLAVAAGIIGYIVSLNNQAPPKVDLAPHTPLPSLPDRTEFLKSGRIPDAIAASSPSLQLLQGKAVLFTAGEMSREMAPGERITLGDGQRVEIGEAATLLLTGQGKGTLKIDNPKTAASAQNKLTVEYQTGRLPRITSVEQPAFLETTTMPFGYTWNSILGKSDHHYFFLPGLKENTFRSRAFEYVGKLYPEGGTGAKPELFDEKSVQWLAK